MRGTRRARARPGATQGENLRRARALGNQRVEAHTLGGLAKYAVADGRLEDAWAMVAASYRIHREFEFAAFIVVDLVRFGAILARQGEADAAAQLVARSDRLEEEIAASRWSWAAEERDDAVAIIRAQLDEASFAEARKQGQELTVDEAVSLAFSHS